jgi:predicted metal-binding transcription factor (methanogenesis marker protein 9)
MSDVIGVRVPKKLKEEIQELNLDYAEEVRACLEKIVKKRKMKKALEDADEFRENLQKRTGLTSSSAEFIREDRERGST